MLTLLTEAGLGATFRLLTTGHIAQDPLHAHAASLLSRDTPSVADTPLLTGFEAAGSRRNPMPSRATRPARACLPHDRGGPDARTGAGTAAQRCRLGEFAGYNAGADRSQGRITVTRAGTISAGRLGWAKGGARNPRGGGSPYPGAAAACWSRTCSIWRWPPATARPPAVGVGGGHRPMPRGSPRAGLSLVAHKLTDRGHRCPPSSELVRSSPRAASPGCTACGPQRGFGPVK